MNERKVYACTFIGTLKETNVVTYILSLDVDVIYQNYTKIK
jgi:hypothetical protein